MSTPTAARMSPQRVHAIGQALLRLDPPTSSALVAHSVWLVQAEAALREANIQLANPALQTATAQGLRDRIDALLEVTPRPIHVNQSDED